MPVYVRWRNGEPRIGRVFPPLQPDHDMYENLCPACARQLGNGEPVQLVVLGPGSDAEDQALHHAGRWYTAVAWTLHADCLGTKDPHAEL